MGGEAGTHTRWTSQILQLQLSQLFFSVFFQHFFSSRNICTRKPTCELTSILKKKKLYGDIKWLNVLRDGTFSLHPFICQNVPWVDITQPSSLHHVSWGANVDMEAKVPFLRDFSVRRWFCSLGVRYITFSIFCS